MNSRPSLHRSADLADHHDLLGLRIMLEHLSTSTKFVHDRIAADATQVEAPCRPAERIQDLVGQRAERETQPTLRGWRYPG